MWHFSVIRIINCYKHGKCRMFLRKDMMMLPLALNHATGLGHYELELPPMAGLAARWPALSD